MFPNLINTLAWWQWTVLAIIPPAIVALYFLKLKRQPLEVPSTYLWRRSIEDLHVNSLWQRLRRNLLLLLQLLLLLLLFLALLRPSWQGSQLPGDRFVFLIDNSASMRATDVSPSRLAEAKQRVGRMIDAMQSGDVAMLVSFSDTARVVQPFTGNRALLRQQLATIRPTDRPTSLAEALKVVAGAVGSRRSDASSDEEEAEPAPVPPPATLYLLSDGNFPSAADVRLSHVSPVFLPVGRSDVSNIGILAFDVRRHETEPDRLQAIARLKNFGPAEADVALELHWHDADTEDAGELVDAARLAIPPDEERGASFDLTGIDQGVLRLTAATGDALGRDDEARVVVSPPRRARVLLVTPGDEALRLALQTDAARRRAELFVEAPAFLDGDEYRRRADSGMYDLIIFDRCAPKSMPRADTWFLAAVPPDGRWTLGERREVPRVIDVATAHPLLAWTSLSDVLILSGQPIEPPPGADVLVDTDAGPMMAIAARDVFQDLVTGFSMTEQREDASGNTAEYAGTNWSVRSSFPVFVMNLLDQLGRGVDGGEGRAVKPGEAVVIDAPAAGTRLEVAGPDQASHTLLADAAGRAMLTRTGTVGLYRVSADGKPLARYAVNLFDRAESDLSVREKKTLQLGEHDVVAQAGWRPARRETWRWWLLGGLVLLLGEWYIYNRRVYL